MTEVEAMQFVQSLVHTWPNVKFTEQNARMYQSLTASLEASEAETARLELAETSKFIPSFAEIREIVMRNRRNARALLVSKPLKLPDGTGPRPEVWGRKLGEMLDDSARYKRMAEAWYASKGKQFPGDPGQAIIEVCQAGARGDDVRSAFRSRVVGGEPLEAEFEDDSERRFP